jgi:hypothetical protein
MPGGEYNWIVSNDAMTFVSRAALVVFVILVPPFFRALVGTGKRHGRMMLTGTLGGIALGVLLNSSVSHWLNADASVLCTCLGMIVGWTVSAAIARHVPPERTGLLKGRPPEKTGLLKRPAS